MTEEQQTEINKTLADNTNQNNQSIEGNSKSIKKWLKQEMELLPNEPTTDKYNKH